MPRNTSGVMVLPTGNPVVSGTLIESTWANPTMSDIAAEITASLPRNGSAGMSGPLMLARDGILPKEAVTVDQITAAVTGSNSYLPAGAIQYFAMMAIPAGWLEADGSAVSRTTYANLFASIGTAYGTGNGTTTFNLPDLRGTFIRGFDHGKNLDPGRVFGSSQAGSNAPHSHSVSDPGHSHTANQPAHSHGISDPGHAHTQAAHSHGISDPGHAHTYTGAGNTYGEPLGSGSGSMVGTTSSVGTGISLVAAQPTIYASGTGISATASQPGVSVVSSATGISTASSGLEARPVNTAMVACIKAFGALQTDGLGSMAFQDKGAVQVTGGTGVFSSLQCTKTPTEPNDVARLSDVGGSLTGVLSSDANVLVVDSTTPSTPILRPQTNVPNGMAKLNAAGQIPASLIPISDINYQGPWDASSGNTPSQAYPATTFHDGDQYQISVGGTLLVYGPSGTASSTACAIGSTIVYVTGSPTFPSSGWYYNPPVSLSGTAAQISNVSAGNIVATNVQAAINELDSEKANAANPSTSGTLTHSGDILLSGSGKRITGDFSNATVANRVMFQTNEVDGLTIVGVIPKGSGTAAYLSVFNSSDPDNASLGYWGATATDQRLVSTKTGTGTYLPMTFYTGGSERMRIDTAGNVGIGDASPSVRLQLKAATNTPSLRIVQDNNSSYGHSFHADSSDSSFKMKKYTAGTDVATILTITGSNGVLVTSPAGLGYGTGSGGTVTQSTSKSTAVTLNKPCGQITMNNATLTAGTQIGFSLNNTVADANCIVIANVVFGSVTDVGSYDVRAVPTATGPLIYLRNLSASPLSEAVAINFAIIKGATA